MLTLILLAFLAESELTGTVIKVGDGDTPTIRLEDGRERKIRLSGIDAPEKDQLFGAQSRQELAKLVLGKEVVVKHRGQYSFDRLVGRMYVGEVDVQMEMVKGGWAWHEPRFSKSVEQEGEQCEARTESRGLWSDPRPVEPWVWRKRKK